MRAGWRALRGLIEMGDEASLLSACGIQDAISHSVGAPVSEKNSRVRGGGVLQAGHGRGAEISSGLVHRRSRG